MRLMLEYTEIVLLSRSGCERADILAINIGELSKDYAWAASWLILSGKC